MLSNLLAGRTGGASRTPEIDNNNIDPGATHDMHRYDVQEATKRSC